MRFIVLFLLGFLLPTYVYASTALVVNINTADKATLMTLTGLGGTGTKAQAVIDYRNQHGPFSVIEDIMKVTGIGQSTFNGFKAFITVGDTSGGVSETVSGTASTSPNSSGGSSTYVPPPTTLSVTIIGRETATLEVPLHLSARATVKSGVVDSSAQLFWSFGDGSSSTGTDVEKMYRYAGTYLVTVTATDGTAKARDELIVTAAPASVRISSVSGEGITIVNDTHERLDLSGWRLASDTGMFRIPDGMMLLPSASVLLPYSVTNLPVGFDATLRYPNGIIAARYELPIPVRPSNEQLFVATTSYKQVQKVESITSTNANIQTHDEAVVAPAPVLDKTGAGAASVALKAPTSGLFSSPWTLSLVGVMVLAAGAFILL
ncbi:MAG: helix-hairpin-helix domain-containing protein [Minisyncoccia bacterium]